MMKSVVKFSALGTTIIELLVYISLLTIFASLCFGLVVQSNKFSYGLIAKHSDLNTTQIASDLLAKDLRISKSILLKRGPGLNLSCKTMIGTIGWQLDEMGRLVRTDYQTTLKKPAHSKVAEHIEQIKVVKDGKNLIQITILTTGKFKLHKVILMRQTMLI